MVFVDFRTAKVCFSVGFKLFSGSFFFFFVCVCVCACVKVFLMHSGFLVSRLCFSHHAFRVFGEP